MSARLPLLLAAAGALLTVSCTATPQQYVQTPKAQRELSDALAGRVAGPPQRCIPDYRAKRIEIIDDRTILYRSGPIVYVQNPSGGCRGLSGGRYTLVTRQVGTTDLCEGDIGRLIDLSTGIMGGTCVFGPFVPYTKTG